MTDNKKLNPDVKAKWLEALRSGKYKQGQNYLKQNDRYCCVGVLCDLYSKETGNGQFKAAAYDEELKPAFKSIFKFEDSQDVSKFGATKDVLVWSGMISTEGRISLDDEDRKKYKAAGSTTFLSKLNDNGNTFDEIAEIIEKYL